MADTAQERTEEATPRKRQQARKKGTVAKSTDLTGAIVIVCMLAVLPGAISNLGNAFKQTMQASWSHIPNHLEPQMVGGYFLNSLRSPVMALVPIVGVALVVGLASNFAQVGFVLSAETLNPNLAKINPLAGLKRLFSAHAGVEGLKAMLKTTLFGWIAYSTVRAEYENLIGLTSLTPQQSLAAVGTVIYGVTMKVAFAWLAIALLDAFYQRKHVDKQIRMTKEELKQEMKDQEQSAELKQAMHTRRRQLSRRMMQDVKTADAVITNPTHFAVAIKYDSGKMHAPQVVAKGADLLAARIREVAKEAKVPLVPNPPLARQLYKKCEVGDFVPRDLFQAVAEVLAYVYKTIRGMG